MPVEEKFPDSRGIVLKFVIPVRHHENARNWTSLVSRLRQTATSIASQSDRGWHAVVVANSGCELPELPDGFSVARVDLPPNPQYDLTHENRERAYDAVRLDKGRRVLTGIRSGPAAPFVMVVDDDDFVSRKLVSFVRQHQDQDGWNFKDGYVWTEGGRFLFKHANFAGYCGTSHVIRVDHLKLAERSDDEHVKAVLGSHVQVEKVLRQNGVQLRNLPFAGAVYRVGHLEAHSKSPGIFRHFLLNRSVVSRPKTLIRNAISYRPLSRRLAEEFGMVGVGR